MPLKISVLATGAVSLDGKAIELDQLEQMLIAAKADGTPVWYYREAAAKDPPPQAMEVVKLIAKNKLAISMSSKPDFSDWVDAKGVSHPRTAATELRMPDVKTDVDIEKIFTDVRKMAGGEATQHGLVIVRPDRQFLVLPPLSDASALKDLAANLERLIPSAVKRKIAVIANANFGDAAVPSISDVNRSIPFLGILMGLSYIGHAVWIFEGHASALEAGCRDADALVVDSGMAPLLSKGWQATAAGVMKNANILIHDRATFKLRIVNKVGTATDRLEFGQ